MAKKDVNKEVEKAIEAGKVKIVYTGDYRPGHEGDVLSVDVNLGRELTDADVKALKNTYPDKETPKGAQIMADKNTGVVSFDPNSYPGNIPTTGNRGGGRSR